MRLLFVQQFYQLLVFSSKLEEGCQPINLFLYFYCFVVILVDVHKLGLLVERIKEVVLEEIVKLWKSLDG